jgi:rod shape-determining protein MreC
MLPIPSRHSSLTLLGIVLGAQILLLAVQIKRQQQVRLIRVWAIELISPAGRAAAWTTDGIGGIWDHYIALLRLRKENEQLQAQLDQLKMRNADLEGRAAEADRLSGLLGFREQHADVPMLAARVIEGSPDAGSRVVVLSRGSRDGVERDMGVMTPEGVVGKVIAVYPHTAQVLLLSDKDSGVGAILAGTRTQAPVRGSGAPTLDMEYVSNDVKVDAGETVVTSGQDRIFPKDLPVGIVVEAKADAHEPFQRIVVRPAAHLDQLEEVFVLLSRQEFAAVKDSAPPAPAMNPALAVPAKPVKSASNNVVSAPVAPHP